MSMAPPFASAEMMIRRPVREVFEAFTDPAVTSHFWFSRGSAKLSEGSEVTWSWDMYGVSVHVKVLRLEQDRSIAIEWGAGDRRSQVVWSFEPLSDNTTFVQVKNHGFSGTTEEVIAQLRDSTEGFTLVLAGLKAWLEHGVELNLVADKHPQRP